MFLKRHLSHAQGYLALGMVTEAAAELGRIAGPDADATEVLRLKIAVLHEQGDWPAVRDLARELVRREAADAAVWVTLAYATRRADSLIAAEILLIKAEKAFPDDATIQFNLGCYASQRGNFKDARRRLDRAIELDARFRELAATDPDLTPLRAAEAGGLPPAA